MKNRTHRYRKLNWKKQNLPRPQFCEASHEGRTCGRWFGHKGDHVWRRKAPINDPIVIKPEEEPGYGHGV